MRQCAVSGKVQSTVMHFIRPVWLTHSGEKKDFEVYSCHVSPDGTRLVTAAGGESHFLTYTSSYELRMYLQMAMSESGLLRPSTMPPTLLSLSPNSWPP